MDINQWLDELGLGQYAVTFAENDIDAATLGELDEEDLRELGIASLGHRKRLVRAIAELGGTQPRSAASEAPPETAPAGERRPVTILFADLTGFTRMSASLDAEDLRGVMDRVFDVVDRIIENYGGTIDKHIGDEVMALFGAPVAHSDDPLRAVRAAIDIQSAISRLSDEIARPLAVHVGIASGPVVAGGIGDSGRDEYTVLGDAVNLAARLNATAKPGESLISEPVRAAVADKVTCDSLGEIEVKGFSSPVPAFRVRALLADPDRPSASPFIGRRNEIRQFTAAIEACRETGAGQTILLRGEAGMGKTRLTEEFSAIAGALGFAVHRALVLDFGVGKDEDAVRELLRGLIGVPSGADEAMRRDAAATAFEAGLFDLDSRVFAYDFLGLEQELDDRSMFEAMDNATRNAGKRDLITSLVRRVAVASPVMLVVEDVHWADPAILGYLAALSSIVATCPAVLVMTTRFEGDPLDHDWRGSTRGSPLLTIDLGPLRPEEAAEMAKRFLHASNNVAMASIERAEGNPLFLEQLLRNAEEHGGDDIPASIQSLVLSRMDRLPAADKRALQAASVVGQRFTPEVVRHLVDDEGYTCRVLLEHHLVRPEGDAYLFAHALIREGVYSSLLNATKRQLHLKAAAWFSGKDPALEAQHLDRAGDPRAAEIYLSAARAQAASYHFDTATMLVRRGLEISESTDVRTRLMACLGDLLYASGDIPGSIEMFEKIISEAESDVQRIPGWIGFAEAMRVVDRIDDGLNALAKAEAAATADGFDLELAHIHHLRGNLLFPSGDFEACRIEHEKALGYAERAESAEYHARALGGLGDAYYASGQMLTALRYFEQCLDIARERGFGSIEVAYLFMRGDSVMFKGQLAQSLEDARRSAYLAARVGNHRAEAFASWIDVSTAFFTARIDIDRITRTIVRMQELIDQLGLRRVIPLRYIAQALLAHHGGDADAVDRLMDEAYQASVESGVAFAGPWILGIHAQWTGKPDRRARALEEGERLLATMRVVSHNYIFFYQSAIEASIQDEAWSEVLRYSALLKDYMSREPTPLTDLVIGRAEALAEFGQGGRDPALIERIRDLRKTADKFGYELALPSLDTALSSV